MIIEKCDNCGGDYRRYPSETARRFCSNECSKVGRLWNPSMFWEKVNKTESCWLWTGSQMRDGYGHSRYFGKKYLPAHRLSYILKHGEIRGGLYVCHKCDNRLYVNPDHLFLGTQKDNLQDASRKGRMRGPVRISFETVKEIRIRFSEGGVSQSALAREFGMCFQHVSQIVNGKTRVSQ